MKAIENFVDAVFSALPRTGEIQELRRSMLEHMQDKYDALRAEGQNEYEALGRVVAEFGSIEELRAGLGITDENGAPKGIDDPELCDLLLDYNLFRPRRRAATAVAVALLMLAPVSAAILSERIGNFAFLVFFGLIAGSIGLFVYFSGRARDYRQLIHDRRAQLGLPQSLDAREPFFPPHAEPPRARRHSDLIRVLNASLPIWVVLLYLCLGFLFGLWHPGWIIFLCIPLYYTTVGVSKH